MQSSGVTTCCGPSMQGPAVIALTFLERRESFDIPRGPAKMAGHGVEDAMKDLIKQYLDNGMSRRQLMTGLSALGMSTVAAKAVAQSLETFGQGGRAASGRRHARGAGHRRRAVRPAAQSRRRRVHLLQSLDRRLSDLRRARGRARHPVDQGHPGRRRGRHGRRLCARLRQDRRRHRRQYRPAQRHDPDGQQLEGPDPGPGRGRLGRAGRARPRPRSRSPTTAR